MKLYRGIRHLFYLNEGPWRWTMGLQAALGISFPIGIFTLLGRQDLGLMASLGGFTVLFCASRPRRDRARILPAVGAGLVLSSAIGVLTSGNEWLTLASLISLTALACIFTYGKGLLPPGPLFFVLVSAVSGHIAAESDPGSFMFGSYEIPLLVALGALAAYLVVVIPLFFRKVRRRESEVDRFSFYTSGLDFNREAFIRTCKVVLGVAIAGFVAVGIESERSYWVIIPVLAVLQGGHNRRHTTIRAFHRTLGTVLGISIFALLAILKPSGLLLVLAIMLFQFLTEVVVTKNYGLALIFITPLALSIATAGFTGNPMDTVQERLLDTFLGAAIALAIFFLAEWLQHRKNSSTP